MQHLAGDGEQYSIISGQKVDVLVFLILISVLLLTAWLCTGLT